MKTKPAAAFLRARWELAALAAVVCAFAAIVFTSSRHSSVTFDESAHVPAGLSYWRTGDFRLEGFNSPLPRLLLAAPLVLDSRVQLPLGPGWQARDIWPVSHEFMSANAANYQELFARARAVVLLAGVVVIILTFVLARPLGRLPALVAAAVIAFDPNFIAHSGVATADVMATAFFLAALLALRRLARALSLRWALVAGAAIGLAVLAKFSAVILPALLPVLLLCGGLSGPRTRPARVAGLTAAALFAAWIVICSFYLWQGVGLKLDARDYGSRTFRLWSRRLAGLPIPLPRPLLAGMDVTWKLNENPEKNFLLGQTYYGGRPWYFPVAGAVKTPLPELAGLALGLGFFLRRRRPWREEWFILLPLAAQAGFVAFASNWNIGIRYLLPAYPFAAAVAAAWLADGWGRRHWKKLAAPALAAGTLVSCLAAWPHYLSYFNVAAGGWRNGHRLLADSNLDWGQDLLYLRDWQRQHPGPLCLVYFGNVDPAVYGISYEVPDTPEQCPTLAISVEHLYEFSFPLLVDGRSRRFEPGRFEGLRSRRPDQIVGATIWIFRQR